MNPMTASLSILSTGLVTAAGLSAPAACAAIRAGASNPSQTRFMDSSGEWIMAHQVILDRPSRGYERLVQMVVMAITECLAKIPQSMWTNIPLLLCLAERSRPGRNHVLDEGIFEDIQRRLEVEFAPQSLIIPQGRVASNSALSQARQMIQSGSTSMVLIAATDSLLMWPTLNVYERSERLLTQENSNGFIPGEGAGAVLVASPGRGPSLTCTGIGFGSEPAHIDSDDPLLGRGMAMTISQALQEAACAIQDIDIRITDVSGEQYYFKEASLAVARLLRVRKESLDIWHASECIGETGAVAGLVGIAVAEAACRKAYAPGPRILWHAANDDGQRTAAIFEFRTN